MSDTFFIKGSSLAICDTDVIFSIIEILYYKKLKCQSGVINKLLWVCKRESYPDQRSLLEGVFAGALNELFANVECDSFNNYIIQGPIWAQQSLGPLRSVHNIIEMRERKDWAVVTS